MNTDLPKFLYVPTSKISVKCDCAYTTFNVTNKEGIVIESTRRFNPKFLQNLLKKTVVINKKQTPLEQALDW